MWIKCTETMSSQPILVNSDHIIRIVRYGGENATRLYLNAPDLRIGAPQQPGSLSQGPDTRLIHVVETVAQLEQQLRGS